MAPGAGPAPAALEPHLQVEEDAAAQELLEVVARGGADGLDHLPLAADQDLLLARPLDEDGGVEEEQVAALLLFPAIDQHRGGEGQLLVGRGEHLLADALRRQET